MELRHLELGDTLTGLLVDGIDGTPFVGAALRLDTQRGVSFEVPYLPDPVIDQFSHLQTWFNDQSPPANMLFLTGEGTMSLFDVSWDGHTETWGGQRASIGKLRPTLVVLGQRDGALADPLVIDELFSRFDGLNEWSRETAVTTQRQKDAEHRLTAMTLHLDGSPGISWKQGDATMTIRAWWSHTPEQDGYARKATVEDSAHIESSFSSGPRPFWDHFIEHRKVANLMVFLFGSPLAFREHRLRDDRFVSRTGDGTIYDRPLTEIISNRTLRERHTATPSTKVLGRPIAYMQLIGADGLTSWSDNYDRWKRFILPSLGVLSRPDAHIEEMVISTSLSLEAAGGIIGERPGERVTWHQGRKPTTATYVYRCLDVLGVQWPERINKKAGLARAIANNYNDVKHYDRGDFPDGTESHVVSEVNRLLVRLLAINLTGRAEDVLEPFRKGEGLYELQQMLVSYELSLDDDGRWHVDPAAGIVAP